MRRHGTQLLASLRRRNLTLIAPPPSYVVPLPPSPPLSDPRDEASVDDDDVLPRLKAALEGQYTVVRELGRGGMAAVYLAHDIKHDREVAVKVLHPDLGKTPGAAGRFEREIRLAAKLHHPHILGLHDSGIAGDLLYYVMPFVKGESVRDRIDREGMLPVDDAVAIALEVNDALGYAHSQGVIHRDIKPENVLLSEGGALVADFGIAKAMSDARTSGAITASGVVVGTPAYLAPEQAAADPNVDERADIYAVGAMAYEMLAGEELFVGLSPHRQLMAHAMKTPIPLTERRDELPPALEQLIMKCLAKDPASRPPSAQAMLQALDSIATAGGRVRPSAMGPVNTPRGPVATIADMFRSIITHRR
jgi:serine/threonine-protein kinase